jgi:hypothetical protein
MLAPDAFEHAKRHAEHPSGRGGDQRTARSLYDAATGAPEGTETQGLDALAVES